MRGKQHPFSKENQNGSSAAISRDPRAVSRLHRMRMTGAMSGTRWGDAQDGAHAHGSPAPGADHVRGPRAERSSGPLWGFGAARARSRTGRFPAPARRPGRGTVSGACTARNPGRGRCPLIAACAARLRSLPPHPWDSAPRRGRAPGRRPGRAVRRMRRAQRELKLAPAGDGTVAARLAGSGRCGEAARPCALGGVCRAAGIAPDTARKALRAWGCGAVLAGGVAHDGSWGRAGM